MSSLLVETVVRGYHIYQVMWEPHVLEKLSSLYMRAAMDTTDTQWRFIETVKLDSLWAIYHEKSQRPVTILQDMTVKSAGE